MGRDPRVQKRKEREAELRVVLGDAPSTQLPPPGDDRPLAIYYLDGVLADPTHRMRHLGKTKRWDLFFAAMGGDEVLVSGLTHLRTFLENCEVVLCTGRPESTRRLTEAWLHFHQIPYHQLWMRASADRRPARIVKPELIEAHHNRRELSVVVEDDRQVVDALRAGGLIVVQARWWHKSR